jgi:T5SS/PEP-CTERM-associated repeat protein
MRRLPLLHSKNAWWVCTAPLILALAFTPKLQGATVITGNVTPALPWNSSTTAKIGVTGAGTLTVDSGSGLTSRDGTLGVNAGSTGMATVTGAGSKWTNGPQFYVGYYGGGSLRVEAGGLVSSNNSTIAYGGSSTGTATITGAGSKWTNSSTLFVDNGALQVEAGGQVTSSTGYVSGNSPTGTGTATITGAGSKWTNSSELYVGNVGSGALYVEAGGQVSTFRGYLGASPGSTGAATITGAGSTWTNSFQLFVGDSGSGALRVEAGGQVANGDGYLGLYAGSTGTATITGAGSKWINSSLFVGNSRVGYGGRGALTVEDGGQVTAATLYASLGDLHGSGTIAASGAVLDADLVFNAMHPTQNVFALDAGGTLTVTPGGGNLGAGYKGFGRLTVAQGVAVSTSIGSLGYNAGSMGTATITGAGSKWNCAQFDVGHDGSGALRVEAGGQASSTFAFVGSNAGSTGLTTITGAGSKWANSDLLYVGMDGSGALRVEAGGMASSSESSLGNNSGSKGTAIITGAGSTWTSGSQLYVGFYGSGSLTINAGGLLRVDGAITIDFDGGADSFVNMSTGGMLALKGDADDSLAQFLGLVAGTDAIRFWNASLAGWTPLTAATLGVDYTLQYQNAGDLNGYTLLTVLTPGPAGDFNLDGRVDSSDLLEWQRGNSPTPNSPADLATWRANFGLGSTTPVTTPVPEPGAFALLGMAVTSLLLGRRSTQAVRGAIDLGAASRRTPPTPLKIIRGKNSRASEKMLDGPISST